MVKLLQHIKEISATPGGNFDKKSYISVVAANKFK